MVASKKLTAKRNKQLMLPTAYRLKLIKIEASCTTIAVKIPMIFGNSVKSDSCKYAIRLVSLD
jgi:hypothetical protein